MNFHWFIINFLFYSQFIQVISFHVSIVNSFRISNTNLTHHPPTHQTLPTPNQTSITHPLPPTNQTLILQPRCLINHSSTHPSIHPSTHPSTHPSHQPDISRFVSALHHTSLLPLLLLHTHVLCCLYPQEGVTGVRGLDFTPGGVLRGMRRGGGGEIERMVG